MSLDALQVVQGDLVEVVQGSDGYAHPFYLGSVGQSAHFGGNCRLHVQSGLLA